MSNTSIIVKDLTVTLQGKAVLDHINFILSAKEHLAVTGPAGSGKTSLAKALAGKLFHEGTIDFAKPGNGEKPSVVFVEQRNEFRNLSNQSSFYYQQRYNSTESEDALTVEQELERHASACIEKEAERKERIEMLLEDMDLQSHADKPLIQLSNGENKRLQLIKALLHQPDVLILDQPFTGLDAENRSRLNEIINQLSFSTTIILITNGNDLPSSITHIASLNEGRLASYSSRNEYKKQEHPSIFSLRKSVPVDNDQADFHTAIQMDHVHVQYGDKKILDDINWKVLQGEKWLVKGPNGAGKSTLLSLINGDNPQAYANDIILFDQKRGSGESIWDIKRKIGYISPELHWYFEKNISVHDTIASGLFDTMGLFRPLTKHHEKIILQWAESLNIQSIAYKPLNLLSSGYQRLVLLARALVKNPPLLILDEPTQGMDDEQVREFVNLIDEISIDKTLLYVSHYENEVPSCINSKLELAKGKASVTTINHTKTEAA